MTASFHVCSRISQSRHLARSAITLWPTMDSRIASPCLEEVSTGACSADDQANLADASTVGEKQDKCGKAALKLTGIDHDSFVSCVQSDLSISASCSECYYT